MRRITKLEPTKVPKPPQKKRVAAYARISKITDRMSNSLSNQVSTYSKMIQDNFQWEYAGVYVDDGISGTAIKRRPDFRRLLADCEAGKIDLILTKSISRFARNTLELLQVVRRLKELDVEVRFEKENISTFSGDGELMLTILASFAQAESQSLSDNIKWKQRKGYAKGIPNGRIPVYGYRWCGNRLKVVPHEAEIVRRIYKSYLDGASRSEIMSWLSAEGIKARSGEFWSSCGLRYLLANEVYVGTLTFQKHFVEDPINKRFRKNRGELPKYVIEHAHEAVIGQAVFDQVQEEYARRMKLGVLANKAVNTSCFTTKIQCGACHRNYLHKVEHNKDGSTWEAWLCASRSRAGKGRKVCPTSKYIPQKKLIECCNEALGTESFDEQLFLESVEMIVVTGEHELEFHFKDGQMENVGWQSDAHKACWTEERKRAKSAYLKRNPTTHQFFLTGRIHCAVCGNNYVSGLQRYKDGTSARFWYCSGKAKAKCGSRVLWEEDLEKVMDKVHGTDRVWLENNVKYIAMAKDSDVILHLTDGTDLELWLPVHKKHINKGVGKDGK